MGKSSLQRSTHKCCRDCRYFTLVSSVIFTSSPLVSSVFHIFSTRSECSFTSSPLVPSVVFRFLTSCQLPSSLCLLCVLRCSQRWPRRPSWWTSYPGKLHSKRVEKMWIYTRNECKRLTSIGAAVPSPDFGMGLAMGSVAANSGQVQFNSKRVEKT